MNANPVSVLLSCCSSSEFALFFFKAILLHYRSFFFFVLFSLPWSSFGFVFFFSPHFSVTSSMFCSCLAHIDVYLSVSGEVACKETMETSATIDGAWMMMKKFLEDTTNAEVMYYALVCGPRRREPKDWGIKHSWTREEKQLDLYCRSVSLFLFCFWSLWSFSVIGQGHSSYAWCCTNWRTETFDSVSRSGCVCDSSLVSVSVSFFCFAFFVAVFCFSHSPLSLLFFVRGHSYCGRADLLFCFSAWKKMQVRRKPFWNVQSLLRLHLARNIKLYIKLLGEHSLSATEITRIVAAQSEAEQASLNLSEAETSFRTAHEKYESRMPDIVSQVRKSNGQRSDMFNFVWSSHFFCQV